MKTIIIPTDFSPVSDNAMQYGVELAKAINAGVLLLHVTNLSVSYSDMPVALVSVEDLNRDAADKLNELKKEMYEATWGSVKIETAVRMGNIIDELEILCAEIKPFAVVMGSMSSTGIDRFLFGSTTLTAIRHLKWPVIAIPPGKKFGSGIKKIGFACDFKDVSATTPAKSIMDIATAFNAELHVLHVDYARPHFSPAIRDEAIVLRTLLEDLKPSFHFVTHKDTEQGIDEFAKKNNIDLLITVPKKHQLTETLFKKSASKKLVYHSEVPVLCVHE